MRVNLPPFEGDLQQPRDRVLSAVASAETIARAANEDPADAVVTLIVAAIYIAAKHGRITFKDMISAMAETLGRATVIAASMFPEIAPANQNRREHKAPRS